MPDEGHSPQFVDQIIEKTLQAIAENPCFDDETLSRLKELANSTGLTNEQRVVEALSARQGE